jgi:hypothetical protein
VFEGGRGVFLFAEQAGYHIWSFSVDPVAKR